MMASKAANAVRVGVAVVLCAACGAESSGAAGSTDEYLGEDVVLAEDWLIGAGETVRVGPDSVFRAANGVSIRVAGTLTVEGEDDAPARFVGDGTARSWQGIVVEQGGTLTLTHGEIDGAVYGIHALAGSSLGVADSEVRNSFKAAVVETDATFDRTVFEAGPPDGIAITDEVTIDDPNGTVTILEASPTFSHCAFNGASAFTDMVRVGGESAPVFDHVVMRDAHCGIHAFGATNNSPRITRSVFENLAYGLMAYAAKPIVEDSVFSGNATDVGICEGATEDNAPVLRNNHYEGGEPVVDPGCYRIGTTDVSPASEPNAEAGPNGL